MKKISSSKVVIIIAVMILMINLRPILKCGGVFFEWFAKSLTFLNQFPEGAQAAIAFTSILLVVVIIFKLIQK